MVKYLDLFGMPLKPNDRGFLKTAFDFVKDLRHSKLLIGDVPVHLLYALSNQLMPDENYLQNELHLTFWNVVDVCLYNYYFKKRYYNAYTFSGLGISPETHCITTEPTREQALNTAMRLKAMIIADKALFATSILAGVGTVMFALRAVAGKNQIVLASGTGMIWVNYSMHRVYKMAADGDYAIIEKPSQKVIEKSLERDRTKNTFAVPTHTIG